MRILEVREPAYKFLSTKRHFKTSKIVSFKISEMKQDQIKLPSRLKAPHCQLQSERYLQHSMYSPMRTVKCYRMTDILVTTT